MRTQTVAIQGKNSIISAMAKHFAVFEVKAELDQLLCGLSSTLGVLELLRSDPALMRPLLVYTPTNPVTADDVFDAFVFCYSPNGSNSREKEEATVMLWVHFLQRIERKHNIELILSSILADCFSLHGHLCGYCQGFIYRGGRGEASPPNSPASPPRISCISMMSYKKWSLIRIL